MIKGVFFVDYAKENIVINNELKKQNHICYMSPAGLPFYLPDNFSPAFSGNNIDSFEGTDVTIPKGSLRGFKDISGNKWFASYSYSKRSKSLTFNGYKHETSKNIQESYLAVVEKSPAIIGVENDACGLEIVSGAKTFKSSKLDGKIGSGLVLSQEKFELEGEFVHKTIRISSCIPDYALELPPIDFKVFSNNVYAKYNYYDKNGVLQKLSTGNYVYSNLDEQGEIYYLMWNEIGSYWETWTPPNPDCLRCDLEDLLSIRTIVGLFVEDGHMILDIIGMVPVVGELADGLNGLWYYVEGENGEAAICMASAFPFVGWISTSGKWIVKGGSEISSFVIKNSDNAVKLIEQSENGLVALTKYINGIPNFSQKHIDLLNTDLISNEKLLDLIIKNPEQVESWKILTDINSKSFVKSDPQSLKKFAALSVENQKLIAQFTDEISTSTLAKFLDECDSDMAKILDENPQFTESFVGHKNGWQVSDYDHVKELFDERGLTSGKEELFIKWLNRSSKAAKFGEVTKLGNSLNKKIIKSLRSQSGRLFDDLASKLNISPSQLKEYDILTEVPLITENGFMKADAVFIKRNVDGVVEDVIVIENKLSGSTQFTKRQKEGWKKIANGKSMNVKYKVENELGDVISNNEILKINSNRVFKISDHGTDNLGKSIIEAIDVKKYNK